MTQLTATAKPTLLVIDAMSLIFQSFHAIRNLTNDKGMATGAIYGFTRQLLRMRAAYAPQRMVVAYDSPGDSFRAEIYEAYKANRDEAPEDFHAQLPWIFKIVEAMGLRSCAAVGYEADDLIGALARRATAHGMRVLIASADKDLFQLVTDDVEILRTRKDDMTIYGPTEVRERMGVDPSQIVDYLALVGDASDNIPGIPGIGPKTAVALLEEFHSLEELLTHPERIQNARRRGLVTEHAESARLSYRLAQIDCDAPLDLDLESARCDEAPLREAPLLDLYRELGFSSLLREYSADDAAPEPSAPQTVESEKRYATVMDRPALEALALAIRQAGRVALDTETTSLDTMRADLVGISLAVEPNAAFYIPIGHVFGEGAHAQLPLDVVREALGPVLADPAVAKVAQNAKFDMRMLDRHGLTVRGLGFDTMLASYVLDPEGRHGLKAMAKQLLGVTMTEIDELIGKGRSALTMDQVEIERAAPYACADADLTLRLADLLGERLEREPALLALFRDVEMPLVEVLDAMEAEGIAVDVAALGTLSRELQQRISEKTREIFELAGHPFTIASPKQVADVLFNEIGLKPEGKTKTGQSTRSEVLERLAPLHPLPACILEYRHLEKMRSTYVEALPQMVHPQTGRIHTSFNQTIAATGRLSSSSPNLQNIPKHGPLAKAIRAAFVPNGPDHVFLAADYSQIELRVLAHISGDAALCQAFREERDIHAQTAARIFGMMPELVTDQMRSQAKVINFGILYGMSAHRLSGELSISRSQAQDLIDEYFEAYPGVRRWSDALIADAQRTGYVETLSGRRRAVANLKAANRNVRANAERIAINTPIQGTSADMIKMAMVRIFAEIRARRFRARMVLQVHDELIFSLPEGEVAEFEPVVRRLMEQALPLEVPVRVDVAVGRNWAEC